MRYPPNLMKMIRSLINLKNLVTIKRLSRRRKRRFRSTLISITLCDHLKGAQKEG
jgi:hypothetical protein